MFTVPEARRPYAHKRDIGVLHGLDGICGRVQSASSMRLRHECVYSWLEDRCVSGFQGLHLSWVDVYPEHSITFGSQAGGGHGANVSQSEDTNYSRHGLSFE